MKQNRVLYYSFFMAIIGLVVGAWVKIMHFKGAELLLGICLLSQLVFMVAAITEVHRSNRIDKSEKSMWIIGFLFMSLIAGLVYLKQGRRRVVE